MQEIKATLKFHDIHEGDAPKEDGYYLVIRRTPQDNLDLQVWWWDLKESAWKIYPGERKAFMPTEYSMYVWTDYFLAKVKY